MTVSKGENIYAIKEHTEKWTATRKNGDLTVCIDIPKDLCQTESDLKEYILSNDLF